MATSQRRLKNECERTEERPANLDSVNIAPGRLQIRNLLAQRENYSFVMIQSHSSQEPIGSPWSVPG
jgi:hypothetical protein